MWAAPPKIVGCAFGTVPLREVDRLLATFAAFVDLLYNDAFIVLLSSLSFLPITSDVNNVGDTT